MICYANYAIIGIQNAYIINNIRLNNVICNQPVAGSIPIASSKNFKGPGVFHMGLFYCLIFLVVT
jgi:hypothetical protein